MDYISGTREIVIRSVASVFTFTAIDRRVVRRSSRSGRHDSAFVECSWPGTGCDCRRAVVYRRTLLAVALRCPHVFSLSGNWGEMSLTQRRLLVRGRTSIDSAIATVVADAVHDGGVVHDGCVVNVVDIGDVYIVH